MSVILRNNSNSSDGIGGGGGNGYITCAVNILKTVGSNGQVKLYWTDPEDTTLDELIFVKWSGTIVVRKEGSPPENENDGTVILNNKTRNAYSTNPFIDNSVSNGTTYYYGLFPYTEDGTFNYELANIARVYVALIHPTFSENTWESVCAAVNSDSIPDTWNLGDTLDMQLSGTYNGSFPMKICDFEHYNLSDGSGKNHITFISNRTFGSNAMCSNTSLANLDYTQTDIHKSMCPGIFNSLPEVLQENVKEIKLPVIANYGKYEYTNTKIFLPSCYELTGATTLTYLEGYSDGLRNFPIFTDDASRKVQVSGSTVWNRYWTRTPYQMYWYYIIEISGYVDNQACNEVYPSVRFCFCL